MDLYILQGLGVLSLRAGFTERSFVPENRPECKQRNSLRSLRIRMVRLRSPQVLTGCSTQITKGLREDFVDLQILLGLETGRGSWRRVMRDFSKREEYCQ